MFNIFATRVLIEQGELLGAEGDGLVIPANDHLWMGSGPGLQVKQEAGEEIETAAVRQGPVALGQSVPTAGGKLSFRRIYHAVVMGQDLKVQHAQIVPALRQTVDLAGRDGLASLVLAPLETEEQLGAFHDAARLVAEGLFQRLGEPTSLTRIVLRVAHAEAQKAYREAFLQALGQS